MAVARFRKVKKTKASEDELLNRIAKMVEKGEKTRLGSTMLANSAQQVTSNNEQYGSYEEIEDKLGMTRSDAQGFAEANIDKLKSPLKEAVEDFKKIGEKMAEYKEKTAEYKKLKAKFTGASSVSVTASQQPHTLETAADTEEAVKEFMEQSPPTVSVSRGDITDFLGQIPTISDKARENTKGGAKTGAGKPRWKKNVAWAIQRLYKTGQIVRNGRNSYSLNPNAPLASRTTGNITLSPLPKKLRKTRILKIINEPQAAKEEQIEELEPVVSQASPQSPIGEPQPQEEQTSHAMSNVIKPQSDEDLFVPKPSKKWYPDKELVIVLNSKLRNRNSPMTILEGPPGVAKTMGVEDFAHKNHLPYVRVQGGKGVTDADLIGHDALVGGESKFQPGLLPRAIDAANKYGTAVLLLDEINGLTPETQKHLNSLTGYNKSVSGPPGMVWRVKPEANLIVMATMNPSNFRATHPLNEELKGRASIVYVTYPDTKVESKVLTDSYDKEPELVNKLIQLANFTRSKQNEDTDWYSVSPRDLSYVLEDYNSMLEANVDRTEALKLSIEHFILNKYKENPDDKDKYDAVRNQIKDIFNFTVS